MSTYTKGPWTVEADIFVDDAEGKTICVPMADSPQGRIERARIIASAPELLNEAQSTDQGYDWFRDQLNDFRLYHGAWSMDESEAWANSLISHVNSRQIGTKAVIAKAEGR